MKKMSMETRKEIIENYKSKYKKGSKKEKSQILTIVCDTTGYSRDRAARLLGTPNKYIVPKKSKQNNRRGRKKKYDNEVVIALKKLWTLLDFACGKRLKVGLKPLIEALERHNEMKFNEEIKNKLLELSPATIDRLLKPTKKGLAFKGKSTTKPGSLLKKDIPIRLGTEWNDAVPGYVEIDLVAHCGGSAYGDFVSTLDVTDINTGWTETKTVLNKAQIYVFNALIAIEKNLPFKYLGIDSDNGSEFINHHLFRYCKANKICFTRGRPNKSNDNCYVEQKNWSVIRKNIGYDRYEGQNAVNLLNLYYEQLRLYTNFFLPQTKLISKIRDNSRIIKKHEIPKTPYQRVLDSTNITEEIKNKLTTFYLTLKPMDIKNKMVIILNELSKIAIPYDSIVEKEKGSALKPGALE